jgi:hypothetical protein
MNEEQELERLFRAERAVRPEPLAREHGLRRLSLDLAAQVATPPIAIGPLKLGNSAVPKWLVGGFALGLLGSSAALPLFAPSSAEAPALAPPPLRSAPSGPKPALARPKPESETAPGIVPSPLQQDAPNAALPSPSARAASSAPSAARAPAASFDAELKLIALAKSELDARRPERAQAWLGEHAQRFPHGVFVVEREALFALAACEQRPPNAALAKRFTLQHPNSPLGERVERACGLQANKK